MARDIIFVLNSAKQLNKTMKIMAESFSLQLDNSRLE